MLKRYLFGGFSWPGRSGTTSVWGDLRYPKPSLWMEVIAYVSLMIAAAITRLWDLGSRAMHHDESLHSYFSWQLSEGDGYQHLPMTHGPLQFEANAAIFLIFGDSDYTARILYAVSGIILIAMPFLLRSRLGKLGALLVSTLLVFSPALLYFSRFARNDILMATWTMGLVITMWKYLDSGKYRYLYASSGFLALAFATKETAYMVTVMLGSFLAFILFTEICDNTRRRLNVYGLPVPTAALRIMRQMWDVVHTDYTSVLSNRAGGFLILLLTLTLPLWSASVSIFQNTRLLAWSNLVFAAPTGPNVGSPVGGAIVIAALIVGSMLLLSIFWGYKWNWAAWWPCALIFYSLWILMFTTFFTNLGGLGSGIWESLGYWIIQQDEARGGQPWYYYIVITSIYEFMPLILGGLASIYYLSRANIIWPFSLVAVIGTLAITTSIVNPVLSLLFIPLLIALVSFFYLKQDQIFSIFLVFWAVAIFAAFTLASEKMPWLLVNLTLPLIVLSGKFLSEVIQGIQWRSLWSGGGWVVLLGTPACLYILWQIVFYGRDQEQTSVFFLTTLGVLFFGVLILMVISAKRIGVRSFISIALLSFTIGLFVITTKTGLRASFENGDVPVEMLVYTQTSPDVTELVKEIEATAEAMGYGKQLPITIDETNGFSWPWAWYLRDYDSVQYQSKIEGAANFMPDTDVIVLHSNNTPYADHLSEQGYKQERRIRHRWWFPEEVYRNLDLRKFAKMFIDRGKWWRAMDYFINRDGVYTRIGSEDSVVYFSEQFSKHRVLK